MYRLIATYYIEKLKTNRDQNPVNSERFYFSGPLQFYSQ